MLEHLSNASPIYIAFIICLMLFGISVPISAINSMVSMSGSRSPLTVIAVLSGLGVILLIYPVMTDMSDQRTAELEDRYGAENIVSITSDSSGGGLFTRSDNFTIVELENGQIIEYKNNGPQITYNRERRSADQADQ